MIFLLLKTNTKSHRILSSIPNKMLILDSFVFVAVFGSNLKSLNSIRNFDTSILVMTSIHL